MNTSISTPKTMTMPLDEMTAFRLYANTINERKAIDELMTYIRTRLRGEVMPTPADLWYSVKRLEEYVKVIKDAVVEVCPQHPEPTFVMPEPVQQVVLPVAEPPCPRPETCVQKHTYARKERTPEQVAEQVRKAEEAQAKRMKDLEKVEEVEFTRTYHSTTKNQLSFEDFCEQYAENVPEDKRRAFWAKFLDEMGAGFQGSSAEVELEERDGEDGDNYECDEEDEFPDLEAMADEFKPDQCDLCEDRDVELNEWRVGVHLCEDCEYVLRNEDKLRKLLEKA